MTCNTICQWAVSLTILICFQIIYSNIAMIRNEIRKILSYYFAKVGRCLCWARCAVERRQIAKFAGHLNFTDNQNPPFKNGIFLHPFLDGFYALGSTLRKPTFPYIIAVLLLLHLSFTFTYVVDFSVVEKDNFKITEIYGMF